MSWARTIGLTALLCSFAVGARADEAKPQLQESLNTIRVYRGQADSSISFSVYPAKNETLEPVAKGATPKPVVVVLQHAWSTWEDSGYIEQLREKGFVVVVANIRLSQLTRERTGFYAFEALPHLKDKLMELHNRRVLNGRRIGVLASGELTQLAILWSSYEANIASPDEAGWVKAITLLRPSRRTGDSLAGRFARLNSASVALTVLEEVVPNRGKWRLEELKNYERASWIPVSGQRSDTPKTRKLVINSFLPLRTYKLHDDELWPVTSPAKSQLKLAGKETIFRSGQQFEREIWDRDYPWWTEPLRVESVPSMVANSRTRPNSSSRSALDERIAELAGGRAGTGNFPNVIKPKNVLFISIDDLRPILGCYGDRRVLSPNIDKLAERSVVFDRAYCQQAVCNPSRASVMTGLRPDSLKVWDLRTHFRTHNKDIVTLPQYFKNIGYETVSIGKIFHGTAAMQDEVSWSKPSVHSVVQKADDYRLAKNHSSNPSAKMSATEFADARDSDYPDGRTAGAAVTELKRLAAAKKPFFLAVGFRKPHLPFTAPQKYWRQHGEGLFRAADSGSAPLLGPSLALHNWKELRGYQDIPATGDLDRATIRRLINGYYACISFVDAQVGRVLDTLERSDAYYDTIVVLWSDHGFHLGEHGLWCKTSNFELDARVPLIMSIPGRTFMRQTSATWDSLNQVPRRNQSLAELVDLYPTIVAATGWPIPRGLDGQDLMRTWKSAAFTQFPRPAYYKGEPEAMGYSMRTSRYRYTEWVDWNTGNAIARELYDEHEDVGETHNVALDPENADLIDELSTRLRSSGVARGKWSVGKTRALQ